MRRPETAAERAAPLLRENARVCSLEPQTLPEELRTQTSGWGTPAPPNSPGSNGGAGVPHPLEIGPSPHSKGRVRRSYLGRRSRRLTVLRRFDGFYARRRPRWADLGEGIGRAVP